MKITDINGTIRDCEKIFPDPAYPGYMRVEFKTEVRSHHVWYPIEDFVKNNPTLSNLTRNIPVQPKDIIGVVTKSTKDSLTDKKQKWTTNAYAGFPLWISRGTGEGQIRAVVKNDHSTLTIDKAWEIAPDKTSQYVLSHNIHDPQPMGNTLPGK